MKKIILKFNKTLKPKTYNLKSNRGFTIVESLVAITILTVGVSASIGAIMSSIQLVSKTENRTIAVGLAQEGVEIVRNMRDLNWIDGNTPWDLGLTDDILISGGFKTGCVEFDSVSFDVNCVVGTSYTMKLIDNAGNLYYGHDQLSPATIFSRTITLTRISADEIVVRSLVACGVNCNISVEEHLFNWQ
ncbi:MAG: prepilin-type N-terminal cleavage/methylation domain-containing protein [Patescibacteria group bacterium]